MTAVRIEGLSESEAERVIAKIWLVLEAQRMITPRLTVTSHAGITVTVSFASSNDADLLARALRSNALAAAVMLEND